MSLTSLLLSTAGALIVISVLSNLLTQLILKDKNTPPVVFHWLPIIGSTVGYGKDPYQFFFDCQAKYGDTFTFVLLGMKVTVALGWKGNNFILNGKLKDLNAEEVYGGLTTPVFGKGVVYDCPNEKLMDQKRLLKDGFSTESLRSYTPDFVDEVVTYISSSPAFHGKEGLMNVYAVMSEITLFSAARSLQGEEVRKVLNSTYATVYRHLDDGFAPINFMLPWAPIPKNIQRDRAQKKMAALYMDIIKERRAGGKKGDKHDMIWTLVNSKYKDGSAIPDIEIAHLMIALLMGGQHNTAASGTWVILHLAHHPELVEDLYREQQSVLQDSELTYEGLQKLKLHNQVIKETLRIHNPVHSIMRKVKLPMQIPDTDIVVPSGHILLAAPGFLSRCDDYFPDPLRWDPLRWKTSSEEYDDPSDLKVDYGYGLVSSKAADSPYLPFGAGRHRCVGEHYAYAQLGAILATMVKLLHWEQVDPEADVPPTDYSSMFSRPMDPVTIRWRRR